jgi:hypothetical protein
MHQHWIWSYGCTVMQEHRRQSIKSEGVRTVGKRKTHFSHFEMFRKFKGADINVIVRKMEYLHLYPRGCK